MFSVVTVPEGRNVLISLPGGPISPLNTRFSMGSAFPKVYNARSPIKHSVAGSDERFYEGLLTKGLTPASALRNAQIAMWKDKRWRQARYWAAFTLQGEWK
jgi:hypothetical protein